MNENELIIVKQLPVIEEQLKSVKAEIETKVNEILSMECTEDTVKTIKSYRADLNKTAKAFENRRKEVKKKVLLPYEKFEATYKNCIGSTFKRADAELAAKIHTVEDGLKNDKKIKIEKYFNEYCQKRKIDFLSFEDTGISITLSASEKSLKESAKAFVDKIYDDIRIIVSQEHSAEIMVEYKKTLNASSAITKVIERHRAIEAEKAAEAEEKKETEKADVQAVQITPLAEAPAEYTAAEAEKLYRVAFSVTDTIMRLKKLKDFLEKEGYRYEQSNS